MPAFLENSLRHHFAKKGLSGDALDHAVYGTLNKVGAMHGNKVTKKGEAMQARHDRGEPASVAQDAASHIPRR